MLYCVFFAFYDVTPGDTIFGRVMVDPVQNLGDSFFCSIEKVFLCTGADGYVPKYDPTKFEFGCLADSPSLLYRFKILVSCCFGLYWFQYAERCNWNNRNNRNRPLKKTLFFLPHRTAVLIKKRGHIRLSLKPLTVLQRIEFIILLLVYKARNGLGSLPISWSVPNKVKR